MADKARNKQLPSFLDIVWFVLNGPAFDDETYQEGVRVYTDAVMNSHQDGPEMIQTAIAAAIKAAVVGYPNPAVPAQAAWDRYNLFMNGPGGKPGGKGRQLVTDLKGTFANLRSNR